MAWRTGYQTTSKEDYKKLIVECIRDAKNLFNDLKYNQFYNAVEMLDSLMESYKSDPVFLTKAGQIKSDFKVSTDKALNVSMIDSSLGSAQIQFSKKQLYQQWYRALVDLATRTVFAGREMDVDIDLESVLIEWKQITNQKLISGQVDKQILDQSRPDSETEEEEAGSDDEQ